MRSFLSLRGTGRSAARTEAILRLLRRPKGLLAMTLGFIFFFHLNAFSDDTAFLTHQNRISPQTAVMQTPEKKETQSPKPDPPLKIQKVDYSSYAGDLMRLDDHHALIYGGERSDKTAAKVIDTATGEVIKNLPLRLNVGEQGVRLLGDVSDNRRFIALVSKPQNDPDTKTVTAPTGVYLFRHPERSEGSQRSLGPAALRMTNDESWIEIALVDEMLQPDELAFNPSLVRRVEKVTSVKVDNDGTVYLLGQLDEFQMTESALGQSWSVGGIETVEFFVKSYKDGHFTGEKRFNLNDQGGKGILFNRLDFVKIGPRPSAREIMAYGPPSSGSLTAVKFKKRLEKMSYLRIENVKGDYAEVAKDAGSILIINAVKWDPDGKFLQIHSLETGELLTASHNLGTFSFPGSFHRVAWDSETSSYLMATTKLSEAGRDEIHLHWVSDGKIRSTSLSPLFQPQLGGSEFSLWGMAFEGGRLIFSLGVGQQFYFLSLPKKQLFSYLKNLPVEAEPMPKTEERVIEEHVQSEEEAEALQVFDEQGRLDSEISVDEIRDFDWGSLEATITFSKPGERDAVSGEVYDELTTVTDPKKIPASHIFLSDYEEGGRAYLVTGRLRLRIHTSYSEEWMRPKNFVLIRDHESGQLLQALDLKNGRNVLDEVNQVMKEVMKRIDVIARSPKDDLPVPARLPAGQAGPAGGRQVDEAISQLVSPSPVFAYEYSQPAPSGVPTKDFDIYSNQAISLDAQGRPVSMAILKGKLFLDWTKKTAAFIRSGDGTRVDYTQIALEESRRDALQSGRQSIAEFLQEGRNLLITGRPEVMNYMDGSFDWILSLKPINIAFFSSDGTLLDIHYDGQSLRESLQTAEVLFEMQLHRLDDEQLVSILTGLQTIADGIQTHLETSRFLNDPRSLLQIQEMLDEVGDVLHNFTS